MPLLVVFSSRLTLKGAFDRMGFVQADPIRAPARAQDLILRHRVKDYHAGDLERLYPKLKIQEDFFIVYGFMTKSLQALMHPRSEVDVPAEGPRAWPAARRKLAQTRVGICEGTRGSDTRAKWMNIFLTEASGIIGGACPAQPLIC